VSYTSKYLGEKGRGITSTLRLFCSARSSKNCATKGNPSKLESGSILSIDTRCIHGSIGFESRVLLQ
jgi:hypothetical protein